MNIKQWPLEQNRILIGYTPPTRFRIQVLKWANTEELFVCGPSEKPALKYTK